MTKVTVAVKRLPHAAGLPLPTSATKLAAGVDLLAALNEDLTLNPGDRQIIPTGIAIALPSGFEAQVRPRSGLAAKHGITLLNSPGTIDADYRGEIKIILINHGKKIFIIERGMRVAQLIISKIEKVKWSEKKKINHKTKRKELGLGSTGL